MFVCPACKEKRGIAISYGYPGPDLIEQVERGDAVLGGCMQEIGAPDRQCLACHGVSAPEHDEFGKNKQVWLDKGIGMRMDTYSHLATYVGWPYTGALMRRLDDGAAKSDKKPGNMYQ